MDDDFLQIIPKNFVRDYFNHKQPSKKYKNCGRKKLPPEVKKAREKARIAKYAKNNAAAYSFRAMKRYAAKLQRTPKWLSESQWNEIKQLYSLSSKNTKETGIKHEVDHIIPLQGKLVSGLHVPWNLQVVTQANNRSKSNKVKSC